jgi:hypothetical protein
MEIVTFLLAMIGYAGLTALVLLSVNGFLAVSLLRLIAFIILIHVILVWAFRYQFQLSQAIRNGYAGFLVFHAALIGIIASNFLSRVRALMIVRGSFLIVTVGAAGAVFRYDEVSIYRIPVILCAATGIIALAISYKRSKVLKEEAA